MINLRLVAPPYKFERTNSTNYFKLKEYKCQLGLLYIYILGQEIKNVDPSRIHFVWTKHKIEHNLTK